MDSGNNEKVELALRDGLLVEGLRVDWFLQSLVDMVNVSDSFEFGITLHVQGSIVSGILISGRKYFMSLGQALRDSKADFFGEWVESFGDIYPSQDQEDNDEKPRNLPGYIHLRDAKVFGAYDTPIPSNEGVLWRGRINAVSGFNIGQLGAGSQG